MSLRVGVLMGGASEEREVSIATGKAVIKACAENGYTATDFVFHSEEEDAILKVDASRIGCNSSIIGSNLCNMVSEQRSLTFNSELNTHEISENDEYPIAISGIVSIDKFEAEATFMYNVDKKEGMGTEMYGVLLFENPYDSGPSLDNYLVSMLIKGKI